MAGTPATMDGLKRYLENQPDPVRRYPGWLEALPGDPPAQARWPDTADRELHGGLVVRCV